MVAVIVDAMNDYFEVDLTAVDVDDYCKNSTIVAGSGYWRSNG